MPRRSAVNEKTVIRIADVAKAANVSVATVSRVLTGSPGVSEETRMRLRRLMKEMGYHPNDLARRLATRTAKNIMIIGSQTPGQVYAQPAVGELFGAIEESLRDKGYRCTVVSRLDLEEDRLGLQLVKERGVDGAIVIGPKINDSFTNELQREGFPFVTIGRSLGLVNVCYVDIDNIAGAYDAVRAFIGMGHRLIAHVAGSLETTVGVERLEGYRRALLEAGLDYREDMVIPGGSNRLTAYENILSFLGAFGPRPTAIFAFNDYLALAVLRAARECGIKVPEDLAVIGFDDDEVSAFLFPPLASVRAPIAGMGRLAAEMLVQIIRGERVAKPQVILHTEFVLRASAGERRTT